ncbi:SHD1 domain-containing protein [Prosthecobacter sp.]|uniref:SHD1 domain-containing protein n=1 Tax=Prosthecobacter sp. TaxID=1965333 RepID=UPI0037830AE7
MRHQLHRLPGISVSVFYLCLAGSALLAAERVWKDASGQNEVRAELVSHKGGNVLLRRADGIVITVPLGSLSKEDQEFVVGAPPPGEVDVLVGELEEIVLQIPKPMFISAPVVDLGLPNMEKFDASKRIKSFMALKGTVNVARGKKVTASDAAPIIGTLDLVTDDDADGADGSFVELAPGKQWLQIDLEAAHTLQKIVVWHYHRQVRAYLDVVIQVSNDPQFKEGVTTLWNSDHDDTSGFGKGKDPTYVETNHGRIIEGKGAKARYVRLWSNGNTSDDMNHYCEVEVFAVPVK